jgi:ribosomal protein S18 acetylase RimI-like enzyme
MTVTETNAQVRPATSDDAIEMAELVNSAGDGLPLYLWAKTARPGQSAWDVGMERARHGSGGFAYNNTIIRENDGKTAACLIGYPLGDGLGATDEEVPAMLVPLLELESLVPHSWYVNVLATYPEHRGKGFATELLKIAETRAIEAGCERICLIVSDTNSSARRLYEKCGYGERATRPIVKEDWEHSGQNWVLLAKDL